MDAMKEREKALGLALGQIERQHGKGAIMRLGEDGRRVRVAAISTGAINLDIATGIGGVPRGRVTEVYGPESSGKTTLALHVIANGQAGGGVAAFIDAEHALDAEYARKLGVDIDNLLVSQPDTGEQGLEIADTLVRSSALDVVVIDSVAALVPRAEIEGEMGDSHVGLQARLMSQALRKLTGSIIEGDRAIGNRTRVKVVKNKMAPPFRQAEFDIMFDQGISREGAVLDLAVEEKLVEKSGAWYSYGDDRLGQGRENVKRFLRENGDLTARLEAALREKMGIAEALAPGEGKPVAEDEERAGKPPKAVARK